ncbi:amidohydrolase family protein [Albibacillus kandeliae]|uniref:amidohydrolase family protein n=1 Tax=Albibacillus kandeliae TaxID=2174228 RepID=UPI000D697871|nr:amidohydrolase family protein [Albibacillus kandeliae]
MIIDIYTHLFPKRYLADLVASSAGLGSLTARMNQVPEVSDLDARFREMDRHGDYRQIIALPHPVLEEVATPEVAARLARLANDEMAEICRAHPDRFPAFVATIALNDVESAVAEIDRAVNDLGARGIQIYTNVAGRPLDLPEFEPVFAAMARHDLPIWLHPARTAAMTDYAGEAKSRFEMWWCFGWPYETSVAVSRLILSGLLDRHPRLKLITHHLGGMIPFFDGRVGPGMAYLGSRTADEDYSGMIATLKRPHLEYFRMLHADTAMFGGTSGFPSGFDFFGAEQIVFASDAPFGPIDASIEALARYPLSDSQRHAVMQGNAERLLGMTFT